MSATAVVLMWKIDTQVPGAIKRKGATKTASIVQITWNMNAPTTPSVAKLYTRQYTQVFDGVGR
jgi:hypothetical protein